MKKRFPKQKRPNTAQQAVALKRLFPQSNYTLRNSQLTWEGSITPSALSETYRVRLCYKLPGPPKVFVLTPKLIVLPGKKLPHVWDDESLCLYYWKYDEWMPHMLLANTILPWTAEWLYHYEIWLVTGEWYGGGVH